MLPIVLIHAGTETSLLPSLHLPTHSHLAEKSRSQPPAPVLASRRADLKPPATPGHLSMRPHCWRCSGHPWPASSPPSPTLAWKAHIPWGRRVLWGGQGGPGICGAPPLLLHTAGSVQYLFLPSYNRPFRKPAQWSIISYREHFCSMLFHSQIQRVTATDPYARRELGEG